MVKVVVLGAGIIATATAYRLLEARPDIQLTIISKEFSPNTTSDGAAGYWSPYIAVGTPEETIWRQSKATYDHCMELIKNQPNSSAMGLSTVHGFRVNTSKEPEKIMWSDIPHNYHVLTDRELKRFPEEIKSGVAFTTVFIEARKLIPYFMKRIKEKGGRFIQMDLKSINEIAFSYDVIVNCTGFGSRDLFNDKNVFAVRGQIKKVRAPWVREFIMWQEKENTSYILPNQDFVVLGGTSHEVEDKSVSQEHHDWISSSTKKLMPSLERAEHIGDWVGFRPARRNGLRYEVEDYRLENNKTIKVVHNYGHGGCGLTVFWGAAGENVDLILKTLPGAGKSKL